MSKFQIGDRIRYFDAKGKFIGLGEVDNLDERIPNTAGIVLDNGEELHVHEDQLRA